jgi:O-methyltransferase
MYYAWGYLPLLAMQRLSISQRMHLLLKFLIVDCKVVHAHSPAEIVAVIAAIAERAFLPGECVLEAGCYQGGSSVKLSLVCQLFGCPFHIYDSFEGVPPMRSEELAGGNFNFSGTYASPEEVLRLNLAKYGAASQCEIHKGWFSDTMKSIPYRTKVAFIDCDLARSTSDALNGIVPSLSEDGSVFSQDFHISPVREFLRAETTWIKLGRGVPKIAHQVRNLVKISWPVDPPGVLGEDTAGRLS